MRIELDDFSRQEVHALLREHLDNMYELSPPESVHALDLTKLRSPDITFMIYTHVLNRGPAEVQSPADRMTTL